MADEMPTESEMDTLRQIMGGEVHAVEVNSDEQELALVLSRIRELLMRASQEENAGVNNLASRLGVSPSAVSRLIRSEGDMRVSTAVQWALALGRKWTFDLVKRDPDRLDRNFDSSTQVRTFLLNPTAENGSSVEFKNLNLAGGYQLTSIVRA